MTESRDALTESAVGAHVLVIGGTGMLARATLALAAHCTAMTLVAKSQRSLERVAAAMPSSVAQTHLLDLDWSDPTAFASALRQHVQRVGPPALTVAWLHDDALGPQVAQAVCPPDQPATFVQVVGSRSVDPSGDGTAPTLAELASVRYQRVVLGFVVEGGASRWLTHDEISAGVLAAIASGQPKHVVGTVEPWSMRP